MFLFISLFLFSVSLRPNSANSAPPISTVHPIWLKLLHFQGSGSSYTSQATGPGFFLTPAGRTDPQGELDEFLRQLRTNPSLACRFPARATWAWKTYRIAVPSITCTEFEKFRDSMGAQSVALVFSSYYLNNPSSAFGHTFLRLSKSKKPGYADEQAELLDYGINFAAVVTTDNAVIYALAGMLGWFKGTFTKMPFYYKIREYSDFESRDLWFYDLNLTQEQISFLVMHLWELGQTHFDYYYFTENCSYQILAALDVVAPERDLLKALGKTVIPAETVQAVWNSPGLVKEIRYFPSSRRKFESQIESLSTVLRQNFRVALLEGPASLDSSLEMLQKKDVLDTMIDYYDYRYARELQDDQSAASKTRRGVLVARSELGIPSQPVSLGVPKEKAPHLSHGSSRVTLMGGAGTSQNGFTEVSYRAAFHDLLDFAQGYPDFAEIEMLNIAFRLYANSLAPRLQRLDLVDLSSLTPIGSYSAPTSWRLTAGMQRLNESACTGCLSERVLLAGGVSLPLAAQLYSYLLANSEGSFTSSFPGGKFRLGLGPIAGVRWQLAPRSALLVEGTRLWFLGGPTRDSSAARAEFRQAFGPSTAFGVNVSLGEYENETGLQGFYYF